MDILIKIAQLILSLSILVIVHEFGHFFFAKLFKTRVEKFYLFFNPWFSLFKFKKGETEYGIGWLPLGGYVKIAGMIDESMDKEQLKQAPKPDEFRSKTTGQRLLIMVGGVMFNFILAILIYTAMLKVWGEEYLPTANMKYGIVCDSTALQMGLKNGDKILSIDNQAIEKYNEIVPHLLLNDAKTIQIERNNKSLELEIPKEIIPKLIKGTPFIAPRTIFVVYDFSKDSPAKKAGLQIGDQILGVDTVATPYFDEFRKTISNYKNVSVAIWIERKGEQLKIPVHTSPQGLIGVMADFKNVFEIKHIEYGFFAAIPAGINRAWKMGKNYLKQFKLIFNKETEGYKSIGGFGSVASIFPSKWDWQSFWGLTGFLSIMLGILNILPIPALDGGHVMFLLYEIITRRKPSDKFLEYAQMLGLFILLGLLLYANGNDIYRFFFEK